jgi:hypothetical protein
MVEKVGQEMERHEKVKRSSTGAVHSINLARMKGWILHRKATNYSIQSAHICAASRTYRIYGIEGSRAVQ